MEKLNARDADSDPAVKAVIAEKKYTLFGTCLIKNAVIGMVIPAIKVAPLVSHWTRFDETLKNTVKFGIIFPVTVVDIEVVNAAASNVIRMPVFCKSDMLLVLFIAFPIFQSYSYKLTCAANCNSVLYQFSHCVTARSAKFLGVI